MAPVIRIDLGLGTLASSFSAANQEATAFDETLKKVQEKLDALNSQEVELILKVVAENSGIFDQMYGNLGGLTAKDWVISFSMKDNVTGAFGATLRQLQKNTLPLGVSAGNGAANNDLMKILAGFSSASSDGNRQYIIEQAIVKDSGNRSGNGGGSGSAATSKITYGDLVKPFADDKVWKSLKGFNSLRISNATTKLEGSKADASGSGVKALEIAEHGAKAIHGVVSSVEKMVEGSKGSDRDSYKMEKEGVFTLATTAIGAVAGFALGGPAGAVMGASYGSTIGSTIGGTYAEFKARTDYDKPFEEKTKIAGVQLSELYDIGDDFEKAINEARSRGFLEVSGEGHDREFIWKDKANSEGEEGVPPALHALYDSYQTGIEEAYDMFRNFEIDGIIDFKKQGDNVELVWNNDQEMLATQLRSGYDDTKLSDFARHWKTLARENILNNSTKGHTNRSLEERMERNKVVRANAVEQERLEPILSTRIEGSTSNLGETMEMVSGFEHMLNTMFKGDLLDMDFSNGKIALNELKNISTPTYADEEALADFDQQMNSMNDYVYKLSQAGVLTLEQTENGIEIIWGNLEEALELIDVDLGEELSVLAYDWPDMERQFQWYDFQYANEALGEEELTLPIEFDCSIEEYLESFEGKVIEVEFEDGMKDVLVDQLENGEVVYLLPVEYEDEAYLVPVELEFPENEFEWIELPGDIDQSFATSLAYIMESWGALPAWFDTSVWGPIGTGADGVSQKIQAIDTKLTQLDGKTISVTIKTTFGLVPTTEYANGGILNGPQIALVGEAGPESIIPLSQARRDRGIALWQETGEILGVLSTTPSTGNNVIPFPAVSSRSEIASESWNTEDSDEENDVWAGLSVSPAVPVSTGAQQAESGTSIQVSVTSNPDYVIQAVDGMDAEDVMGLIRSRSRELAKELADDIGGELAGRLEMVYDNVPLKGVS